MSSLRCRTARAVAVLAVPIACLLSASAAWAPTGNKPEKIKRVPVKWNGSAFELELAAQFGLATGGEQGDFTIAMRCG